MPNPEYTIVQGCADANASEHGARMTAMDKATENANEILRSLRISYNCKTRRSQLN
jgi:F0F1-type ATP synthase gamma subunit